MKVKAAFLVGGAVGYVLGTRAGREQFDKIRASAQNVWESPKVQDTVSEATGFVKEKAPDLKDKVTGAVRQATEAVRGKGDDDFPGAGTGSSSTYGTTSPYGSSSTTDTPPSGTSY